MISPLDEGKLTRADAHVHLFARGYRSRTEPVDEFSEYQNLRLRHGIGVALIVAYEGERRHRGNSEYALNLSRQEPAYRALRYLERDRLADSVWDEDAGRGYFGYSLYLEGNEPPSRWRGFKGAHRPPILSVNASPEALTHWGPVLADSGAVILVSHLGLPGRDVAFASTSVIRARLAPLFQLVEASNIHVKLSGLYAIDPVFPHEGARPVLEEILDAFGEDRLVWGSDYSAISVDRPGTAPLTPEPWVDTLLGAQGRAKVHGANLVRLLNPERLP